MPRKIPTFPKHPSRDCPPEDLKMQIDPYFTHEPQNHQNSTFTRITKDLHVQYAQVTTPALPSYTFIDAPQPPIFVILDFILVVTHLLYY